MVELIFHFRYGPVWVTWVTVKKPSQGGITEHVESRITAVHLFAIFILKAIFEVTALINLGHILSYIPAKPKPCYTMALGPTRAGQGREPDSRWLTAEDCDNVAGESSQLPFFSLGIESIISLDPYWENTPEHTGQIWRWHEILHPFPGKKYVFQSSKQETWTNYWPTQPTAAKSSIPGASKFASRERPWQLPDGPEGMGEWDDCS